MQETVREIPEMCVEILEIPTKLTVADNSDSNFDYNTHYNNRVNLFEKKLKTFKTQFKCLYPQNLLPDFYHEYKNIADSARNKIANRALESVTSESDETGSSDVCDEVEVMSKNDGNGYSNLKKRKFNSDSVSQEDERSRKKFCYKPTSEFTDTELVNKFRRLFPFENRDSALRNLQETENSQSEDIFNFKF